MPIEQVKVPRAGESIAEATVNRWLKPNGAFVQIDEPLFELGTDKATQEVAAPAAGVLTILVAEGTTVPVDAVVAQIDTDAKAPATVAVPAVVSRESSNHRDPAPIPSPAAARVLAEANLRPEDVRGTGPGGRITKEDALQASQSLASQSLASQSLASQSLASQERERLELGAPVAYAPGSRVDAPGSRVDAPGSRVDAPGSRVDAPGSRVRMTRQPLTPIRRRIAERLLESQNTTATLTTFNEADMTAIQELRARYNDRFEKKHGVKIGFMSIFVKAAVEALKAFPMVNARIDGSDLVMQHFYDIGVAVSTEKGLMVPILRNADQLGFADIEKRIAELAKKARDGKIGVPDLEGGTFTITNGGIFGSMMSTPILNPPQAAILGMHSIQKRPVVINDQIVIRPMMYLALSYDHRLIDGREAVQFLVRIKECVENPERMLLDV